MNTDDVRSYNEGDSNYYKFIHQPWDIWINWKLDPFRSDIVKRILRTKPEPGMTIEESRDLDKKKIMHVCKEIARQNKQGIEWEVYNTDNSPEISVVEIAKEYNLSLEDATILGFVKDNLIGSVFLACEKQLGK